MKIVTIQEANGEKKRIGHVEDDTFVTQRVERKHLYKGGNKTLTQARKDGTLAWGIDAKACDGLLEKGITWFRIESDKCTYVAPLQDMKNHEESFVLHYKPHRAQYFLPVSYFRIQKKTPTS